MSKENVRSRFFALLILMVASILFLAHSAKMNDPLVAFCLTASAWAIATVLLSRSEFLRNSATVCSSLLFALALVEASLYFVTKSRIIVTKTTPAAWRRDVAGLGAFPIANTVTEFQEFLDGRPIADVTYRIDASGLREIASSVQGRPHRVAFFGCSFMFGHGIENDQTLPYYFVRAAKGSFEGFNFAGEGWGPHQMLREIETGFVRRVAGTPDLAIYEAIPDHLRRVAGRAPWESGPKYVLCPDHGACYSGPFHNAYYEAVRHWVDTSWTGKFIEDHFVNGSQPSDIPVFLTVLKRARSLLEKEGTGFLVIVWDQNELAKTMIRTLRANQFEVIALSSIFAESDLEKRPLEQLDRHPSPATNKAIATYLWERIGARLVVDRDSKTEN